MNQEIPKIDSHSKWQEKIEKLKFAKIDIALQKPYSDKKWMITFQTNNKKMINSYDLAIKEICEENNLSPFHQININDSPKGHLSGWEMWRKTDEQFLLNLIPDIHKRAEKLFDDLKWLLN